MCFLFPPTSYPFSFADRNFFLFTRKQANERKQKVFGAENMFRLAKEARRIYSSRAAENAREGPNGD